MIRIDEVGGNLTEHVIGQTPRIGQADRTDHSNHHTVPAKLRKAQPERLEPLTEFCYNLVSHSAIGMSLFQVNYGRQPLTPLAFTKAKIETSVPEVEELLTGYQGTRTLCKRILEGVGLGPFAAREEVVTQEEVLARKAILE